MDNRWRATEADVTDSKVRWAEVNGLVKDLEGNG